LSVRHFFFRIFFLEKSVQAWRIGWSPKMGARQQLLDRFSLSKVFTVAVNLFVYTYTSSVDISMNPECQLLARDNLSAT